MNVNVSALIIDQNKVLVIQRGLDDEYSPGFWEVPGGKMEATDLSIQAAAEREVLEENSLKVKAGNEVISNNLNPETNVLFLKILCSPLDVVDYNFELKLEKGIHDFRWVSADELTQFEFVPTLKDALTKSLIGKK